MGSLFRPSVPRYPAFTYQPRQMRTDNVSTVNTDPSPSQQSGDDAAQNRTTPPPQEARQQEEESVREFIRRNNRGRNALIQTSYRGVLTDLNDLMPQRKNLLGE